MLAFRCGFDGHTQGTQQVGGEPGQGGAYGETKCGHQSSPKTSKWHIFSFIKCKGKLGSLNCFFCCFSAVPFPPTNVHSGSKLVFGLLESTVCKKTPVQIQLKNAGENIHQMQLDLRKTRADWRNMLQNMLPHPTPGERDSILMFFYFCWCQAFCQ